MKVDKVEPTELYKRLKAFFFLFFIKIDKFLLNINNKRCMRGNKEDASDLQSLVWENYRPRMISLKKLNTLYLSLQRGEWGGGKMHSLILVENAQFDIGLAFINQLHLWKRKMNEDGGKVSRC